MTYFLKNGIRFESFLDSLSNYEADLYSSEHLNETYLRYIRYLNCQMKISTPKTVQIPISRFDHQDINLFSVSGDIDVDNLERIVYYSNQYKFNCNDLFEKEFFAFRPDMILLYITFFTFFNGDLKYATVQQWCSSMQLGHPLYKGFVHTICLELYKSGYVSQYTFETGCMYYSGKLYYQLMMLIHDTFVIKDLEEIEIVPRFAEDVTSVINIIANQMQLSKYDQDAFNTLRSRHIRTIDVLKSKIQTNLMVTGTACCGKTSLIADISTRLKIPVIKSGKHGEFKNKDHEVVVACNYLLEMQAHVFNEDTTIMDRSFYDNYIWRFIMAGMGKDSLNEVGQLIVNYSSHVTFSYLEKFPIIFVVDVDVAEVEKRMRARGLATKSFGDMLRSNLQKYVQLQNFVYFVFAYLTKSPVFCFSEIVNEEFRQDILNNICEFITVTRHEKLKLVKVNANKYKFPIIRKAMSMKVATNVGILK